MLLLSFISTASAQTAAAPSSPAQSFYQFIPLVMVFVIFYFLLIRPQQKQQKLHKQMIDSAKKGDEVLMNSGIHGKITELNDDSVHVQIAANTVVKFDRATIATIKGYEVKKAS
jgi:preprotein translocase subunit YajC